MKKVLLFFLLLITLHAQQQENRVIEADWSQAQYWPEMEAFRGNQGGNGNGNGNGPGGNGNGNNGNGGGNTPIVPEPSAYSIVMLGTLLVCSTFLRRPKRIS